MKNYQTDEIDTIEGAFKKNLQNITLQTLKQFLLFGMVGLSGLGVSLIIVNFVMAYKENFAIANILSFFFAVTWNYFLNRKFTFQAAQKRNLVIQWVMFACSSILGTACNWMVSFGLYYSTNLFAEHYSFAMVCGVAVGYIVNFICAKRTVFKSGNNNLRKK